MPRIIAFDTSTTACSVGLCCVDSSSLEVAPNFLFSHVIAPRRQAQLLLPMLETLLSDAGFVWNQIDAIAFTNGPGSFTGIRLAISVAQGLGFATGLPLVPISTLHAMAQTAYIDYGHTQVLSVLEAPMRHWYYGLYQARSTGNMTALGLEKRGTMIRYTEYMTEHESHEQHSQNLKGEGYIEESQRLDASWIAVGHGCQPYPKEMESIPREIEPIYPHAREVARLGLLNFQRGLVFSPDQVFPEYLYGAEQWRKAVR